MTVIQSILWGLLVVAGFSLLLPEVRKFLARTLGRLNDWVSWVITGYWGDKPKVEELEQEEEPNTWRNNLGYGAQIPESVKQDEKWRDAWGNGSGFQQPPATGITPAGVQLKVVIKEEHYREAQLLSSTGVAVGFTRAEQIAQWGLVLIDPFNGVLRAKDDIMSDPMAALTMAKRQQGIAPRPDLLDAAPVYGFQQGGLVTDGGLRADEVAAVLKMPDEQLLALKPQAISAASEVHDLYKTTDESRPATICDTNGEVVLALCKRCGRGEAELWNEDGSVAPCVGLSEAEREDRLRKAGIVREDVKVPTVNETQKSIYQSESSKVPRTVAALNDWIAANFEVRRGYATRTWHYAPQWAEGIAPPALQEREFRVLSMYTTAGEKAETDLVYAMWHDLVTLKLNMNQDKPIMAVRSGLTVGDFTYDFDAERCTTLYFRFDLPQLDDGLWGLAKCLTREGDEHRRVPVVSTSGYMRIVGADEMVQAVEGMITRNFEGIGQKPPGYAPHATNFEGLGQVLFSDDVQAAPSEQVELEAGHVAEMYHAGTRRFYQVAVKGALTRELKDSEDPAARSIAWLTDALHRAEDRARTMEAGYTTATQMLFKHAGTGMVTSSEQMTFQGGVTAEANYVNVVQADLWLQWRDEQIKLVESLRREKFDPTLNPRPIANLVDYAAAAQAIELAMQALDESLPNGQRARSEQALKLATEGLTQLRTWMTVKGYMV